MPNLSLRNSLILVSPLVLLVLAWLFMLRMNELLPQQQELLLLSPYIFAGTGILLAFHFHRGRSLAVFLIIALVHWYSRTAWLSSDAGILSRTAQQTLAYLLPANILLFTLMRERGILNPVGKFRLFLLAAEALAVTVVLKFWSPDLHAALSGAHLLLPHFGAVAITKPLALFTACCFIGIVACALIRQSPIESGMTGVLAATFLAVVTPSPLTAALFLSSGAVILIASIVQDSYNMAFRDDLTGIPSRRALNEMLLGIGRQYAVAMVDIDHFKKFNDTYGHDVGDQVLKLVAKRLERVGSGGKAFRYGGEEFTILFPKMSSAEVLPFLEEVRTALAAYKMALRCADRPSANRHGRQMRGAERETRTMASVTISIGVSDSTAGATPAEVIKIADQALYKAKNLGRNQVCTSVGSDTQKKRGLQQSAR